MTYFEFLFSTGSEDGPDSYIHFLTKICGYDRDYAQRMAGIQYRNHEREENQGDASGRVTPG